MPYLTLTDLAERWGIKYQTLAARRHRGRLPEPDIMLGRTPAWTIKTIERLESTDGQTRTRRT